MAVVKIKTIKSNLEAVINYAKNGDKTENGILVTGVNCIPQTAYNQMALTKKFFHKENGRQGYHIIQSFNGKEVSPQEANEIGTLLAEELFGDKYQAIVCTHINKDNVHNHIVLNSVSFIDGSKYHNSKLDIALIKDKSDELCKEYELSVVQTAKANVATQEITVKNKRELNKKNIISDYDLEMAENTLASAKAQLASAEAQLISANQNLAYTRVTSPSNGVAGSIPFRVGSLVSGSSATPLTTVSDISEMYVYFSLTEKELLNLIRKDGSQQEALNNFPPVQLTLADGTLYGDSGKIETVRGVIDQNTGAVSIRATFPNKGHLLRTGGTGSILIPYSSPNALVVPQKATYEIQDKKFVYVLQDDNTVKNTEIKVLNLDDGQNYIVTSGLNAGDKIVLENVSTLKDGATIKPLTPQESAEHFKASLEQKK